MFRDNFFSSQMSVIVLLRKTSRR